MPFNTCPILHKNNDEIILPHGGGGKLQYELIQNIFREHFENPFLEQGHDGTTLPIQSWESNDLVFTTDSYVVKPLYFRGGSIGELSVYGTVNDIAMCGAEPLFLSCSLIIEEGLKISLLDDIVSRMARAALKCNVKIVTGDTKVVEKNSADGIFINTSGIGRKLVKQNISALSIQQDDDIIISGDLGRHSLAILAERNKITMRSDFKSDLAPLHKTVQALIHSGIQFHCLRDLTRGGLAGALHELRTQSNFGVTLYKEELPIETEVEGLCEIMGLDPLFLTNEGCFIIILPSSETQVCLKTLKDKGHFQAKKIGVFHKKHRFLGEVNGYGFERIVDWPMGDPLPRLC